MVDRVLVGASRIGNTQGDHPHTVPMAAVVLGHVLAPGQTAGQDEPDSALLERRGRPGPGSPSPGPLYAVSVNPKARE